MFDLRNHFCRKCYQEIQYLDSQPAYLSRLSSESRVACRGGQAFATQVYSVTWKGYISVQYCSDNSKNLINVSFLGSNVIITTHSSSKKKIRSPGELLVQTWNRRPASAKPSNDFVRLLRPNQYPIFLSDTASNIYGNYPGSSESLHSIIGGLLQ